MKGGIGGIYYPLYFFMKITLYNTTSPYNCINKTLTDSTDFEVKLKDSTSISKPTLLLNTSLDLSVYNYCYIPKFKRYYFLTDIIIQRQNLFIINLDIDVLESYKNDILNSTAYISQTVNSNPYYNRDYETEIRKKCTIYKSSITNELNNNIIMVTVGGV